MSGEHDERDAGSVAPVDAGMSVVDGLAALWLRRRLLVLGPIVFALLALGISYLIPPTFTARTSLMPPQHPQSAAAAALSQLGALAGLAGGAAGPKSPSDLYVALMQSVRVSDRLIDQFGLMQAYEAKYRFEARKSLSAHVRITTGKKDGLITIEVDDREPERAARMANQYVEELRLISAELALTEAQQRRAFFETQLQQVADRLGKAQSALQSSGFNPGALKAEPKAAAEGYAQLRAEVTAAEVRLQTLRRGLADGAPEVQQQLATLGALRAQLTRLEGRTSPSEGSDYVSQYRDFKYQETLFELLARQLELARLDESREGALIQVIDVAQVPEWKSKPKRAVITVVTWLVSFIVLVTAVWLWAAIRSGGDAARLVDALRRQRADPS